MLINKYLTFSLYAFFMRNSSFSRAVLGNCLLISGLLGCRQEADPTPLAAPPRVQFHLDYQKAGTSAPGYLALSSRPLRHANDQSNRLYTVMLKQPATGVVDFDFAREVLPDTLYVSLSYQNVLGRDNNGGAFQPPTTVDAVQVTLTMGQRPPVTLRIDAASLQNLTTRWTDAKGQVHSSLETYLVL
jgi:hypothetical protein